MRQNWTMTDKDKKWHSRWSDRTEFEQSLLTICAGLLALVVLMAIQMTGHFAPLKTDWGSVAEWVGAGVTFLGFAGAIAALRVQVKSNKMQTTQHERTEKGLEDEATAQEQKKAADARQEKERFVSKVKFTATALHYGVPGQQNIRRDGKLVLECSADFPASDPFFTDCRLIIPQDSRLKDFEIQMDRVSSAKMSLGGGCNLGWKITGDGWFGKDLKKAQDWLNEEAAVEFTDPNGVRWRMKSDKSFVERTS